MYNIIQQFIRSISSVLLFKIMYKFSIKSGFLSGYLNAQYG